jgi:hypothetical protein
LNFIQRCKETIDAIDHQIKNFPQSQGSDPKELQRVIIALLATYQSQATALVNCFCKIHPLQPIKDPNSGQLQPHAFIADFDTSYLKPLSQGSTGREVNKTKLKHTITAVLEGFVRSPTFWGKLKFALTFRKEMPIIMYPNSESDLSSWGINSVFDSLFNQSFIDLIEGIMSLYVLTCSAARRYTQIGTEIQLQSPSMNDYNTAIGSSITQIGGALYSDKKDNTHQEGLLDPAKGFLANMRGQSLGGKQITCVEAQVDRFALGWLSIVFDVITTIGGLLNPIWRIIGALAGRFFGAGR